MAPEESLPGVRLELLDAQREPPVAGIDIEDHGLDELALFQQLGGMLDALGPGQIGDVNQTVDALFDFDEGAEVRQLAHPPLHHRADAIAVLDGGPRIGLELLDAERNPPVLRFHFQHHGLDVVANFHYFRGMLHAARPRHLGDVDEALDAGLELDEGAIIGDADHSPDHPALHGVFLFDVLPGIRRELFEAE